VHHTGFHPVCLFNDAPQRPELEESFRRACTFATNASQSSIGGLVTSELLQAHPL